MAGKESPEETQHDSGHRPGKAGKEKFDGGGFREGEAGRGPTPYLKSHSSKPNGHSIEAHMATAGRGGSGFLGKGDSFKGAAADVEHPQTHAEFENLGVAEE